MICKERVPWMPLASAPELPSNVKAKEKSTLEIPRLPELMFLGVMRAERVGRSSSWAGQQRHDER